MKRIYSGLLAMLIFFTTTVAAVPNQPELAIDAKAAVLMEAETGKVLYESNPDQELPIASVTKIMTMLLIMEAIDDGKIKLEDQVSVSERAMSMGGSTMFLETGESLSVHDMLKGIAVASANDGCVAMAEFLEGSVESFVEKMNKRAKELGMENTNFVNTNGLDAENHYSSALDVAKMSRELLKHELIFNYTTIWTDSLRDGKFELANTNKLVRFYDGATGLKTGSTSKALCCVSATAKREDMHLIAVILGAPNSNLRFSSARTLLDYGFSSYAVKKYTSSGEELQEIEILKGVEESLRVYIKEEISVLQARGDTAEAEREINIKEGLKAPIEKGEAVGEIIIKKDGEEIGRSEICAGKSIPKKTFLATFGEVFSSLVGEHKTKKSEA